MVAFPCESVQNVTSMTDGINREVEVRLRNGSQRPRFPGVTQVVV